MDSITLKSEIRLELIHPAWADVLRMSILDTQKLAHLAISISHPHISQASPYFSHSWLKALQSAETDFAANEESIFLNIDDERDAKDGRQMRELSTRSVKNTG